MTEVLELTNNDFEDFIKEGAVVIDFYAEWCMPCMMMVPIIEEMNEKFKGKIKFAKVNIEENQEIAKKFNISSIPNFIFLKDGKVVENFVGGLSSEDFEEKLDEFLK